MTITTATPTYHNNELQPHRIGPVGLLFVLPPSRMHFLDAGAREQKFIFSFSAKTAFCVQMDQ